MAAFPPPPGSEATGTSQGLALLTGWVLAEGAGPQLQAVVTALCSKAERPGPPSSSWQEDGSLVTALGAWTPPREGRPRGSSLPSSFRFAAPSARGYRLLAQGTQRTRPHGPWSKDVTLAAGGPHAVGSEFDMLAKGSAETYRVVTASDTVKGVHPPAAQDRSPSISRAAPAPTPSL